MALHEKLVAVAAAVAALKPTIVGAQEQVYGSSGEYIQLVWTHDSIPGENDSLAPDNLSATTTDRPQYQWGPFSGLLPALMTSRLKIDVSPQTFLVVTQKVIGSDTWEGRFRYHRQTASWDADEWSIIEDD